MNAGRLMKITVVSAMVAFCAGSGAASTLVVAKNADSGCGSLREALANAKEGDLILFDLRRGQNVIELKTPLAIPADAFSDRGLTIGGDNGGRYVEIRGDGSFCLLTIGTGNNVKIDGVTFANGKANSGGAICNYGAVTIRNCGFVGNSSPSWGGAICNMRAASCYVQNTDFTDNSCEGWGGAVASHTTPLTTLLGCRFRNNTCSAWGGAIAACGAGDMLVIDCEVRGNESYGGAVVAQSNSRLTLIGSSVSGNTATLGGADVYNLGGTVNAIGSYSPNNSGTIVGTTDLRELPKSYSSLLSTDVRALGGWYSPMTNRNGVVSMQLNGLACPCFAPKAAGKPVFEMTDEDYVTMSVDNVKPLLYYGLGWADAPGGEFTVAPGCWVQADASGRLPSDVRAPKGNGSSRFFRVKVTDDPTVVK